jgi:hypothetical protein
MIKLNKEKWTYPIEWYEITLMIIKKKKSNVIRNEQGKLLLESEERAKRWQEYLEKLYSGNEVNEVLEEEWEVNDEDKGDKILRSEFVKALKSPSQ